MKKLILFILINFHNVSVGVLPQRVLICGVCKDVEQRLPYSIKIMERIGKLFSDHRIVVYENNSSDNTPHMLKQWTARNSHVEVMSEVVPRAELEKLFVNRKKNSEFHISEPIARARNIVLDRVMSDAYAAYEYLIWMDMDFKREPDYAGIKEVFEARQEWDAVFAYGVDPRPVYWDWYAFRDANVPIGSELLGNFWWYSVPKRLVLTPHDPWYPVYSAFGGCGIYKKSSIQGCRYSALVTPELAHFYHTIIKRYPAHPIVKKYLHDCQKVTRYVSIDTAPAHRQDCEDPTIGIRIPNTHNLIWRMSSFVYKYPSVCEHVPFHAAMIIKGHDKLFINPRLIFRYSS